jgi:hypothetical protein
MKRKLIAAYQRMSKNEKLQKDWAIWDEVSGDGL